MSGKVVLVISSCGVGTTKVDLDRCQEFAIGPPIIHGEPPVDWSQYLTYYLTPDLRWIVETHRSGRVSYQETTRKDVRNHALGVGWFLLPPELQTENLPDKKTTADPLPPPNKRPSRPGVPTLTFFANPEEVRQFRDVSNGTVKSADEETDASRSTPPQANEQPAAPPPSGSKKKKKKKRRRKKASPAAANASGTVTPEAPAPPVVLGKAGDKPVIRGKPQKPLTVARYHVVKALLDAGDDGLTGDDLVNKSGHGGAVNMLKALAKSGPDWEAAILLAGQPGARYRIVSKSDGS